MYVSGGIHYCRLCGRTISNNGMGRASHRAKHIREGLIEQYAMADGREGYRETAAGRAAADAVAERDAPRRAT